jgi:hypothetical protein
MHLEGREEKKEEKDRGLDTITRRKKYFSYIIFIRNIIILLEL